MFVGLSWKIDWIDSFVTIKIKWKTYTDSLHIETQGFSWIDILFSDDKWPSVHNSFKSAILLWSSVSVINDVGKYRSQCLKCVNRFPFKYNSFKFFNIDKSPTLPTQFSDKFNISNCKLLFKCSIVLILLPCKFNCFNWTRSFNPSMVKILLLLKLSSCRKCNRHTPYIRSKLFFRNESCLNVEKRKIWNENSYFMGIDCACVPHLFNA